MSETVKPCVNILLTFGKMFGYTPIKLTEESAETSKLAIIHGILIIAVYTSCVIYDAITRQQQTELMQFVNLAQIVTCVAQFLASFFLTWRNLDKLKAMTLALINLETAITTLDKTRAIIPNRKLVVFAFLSSLFSAVTATTVEYCFILTNVKFLNIRFLIFYLALFFSTINVVQLSLFSFIIFQLYKTLSKYLDNILSKDASFVKMVQFRNLLIRVNNVVDHFNSCYSYQLVYLLLNNFVVCTVQMYYVLCMDFPQEIYLLYCSSIGTKILIYSFQIVIPIVIFQQILNQISAIIQKLLLIYVEDYKTVSSQALDIAIEQKLFPVCFTAGNFFSMNHSTLLSMVGTIATYLIILVQFKTNAPETPKVINLDTYGVHINYSFSNSTFGVPNYVQAPSLVKSKKD